MRTRFFVSVAATVVAIAVGAMVAQAAPTTKQSGDTPESRRATAALNILEAQGYGAGLEDHQRSAFADFEAQGKDFIAVISQGGRRFKVSVDPDTGTVQRLN